MPTQRVGDTVVKTYADELRWQWGREVAFLRRVESSHHFPRLIGVGDHSITTDFCGESIANHQEVPLREIRLQIAWILDSLRLMRIHHRDITIHNVLWNSGELVLIDFGWSHWHWEPDAPMPLPHVMHGMYKPDAEQAEDLLRQLEEMRK